MQQITDHKKEFTLFKNLLSKVGSHSVQEARMFHDFPYILYEIKKCTYKSMHNVSIKLIHKCSYLYW